MVAAFPLVSCRRLRLVPAALAMLWLPALAHAQSQALPSQDLGGSVFQMLFGLSTVLVLMLASLWLLKRLAAPRGPAGGLMRVVAGAAVGTRERVVIVEIGATWLVLGVAPGSVTALAELPRGELPPEPASPKSAFAERLQHMVNRRHAP